MKSSSHESEITPKKKSFPVVVIGAASGGAEALAELLRHLPDNTGMSFLFVQHPDTFDEEPIAALSRATKIPLTEAEDNMAVEPNHLYLLPNGAKMTVVDGQLKTIPEPSTIYNETPINVFFGSVAEQYREQTIGVLLSGSTSDGAMGLKAIKIAGGLTLVQDDSARFQTMPRNAVTENAVDLVLSPKELAEELVKFGQRQDAIYSAFYEMDEELFLNKEEDLRIILNMLHRQTGVDFALYKINTIKRRIIRRMMLRKLESLHQYIQYLKQDANEINLLYQDVLINVTSFFRDTETVEHLKNFLLPRIIKSKGPAEPVRVWVPACSTGQEAYSVAMLIMETLGDNPTNIPVQIFATDLSEIAINKARLGIYTKDDVADISPKYLQRFFSKLEGQYRIIKNVRDLCVFATHNIAKDPPFSKLDLISCCNLLIYLESQLQKKLIATFHYSLNNTGYLVLGKSETIGASTYLFSPIDKKAKVYAKKKETMPKAMFEMNYRKPAMSKVAATNLLPILQKGKNYEADLEKAFDTILLKKFTPASVVVNYDLDILQFRGSTGVYLEPSPGKASLNLMKMARLGLGFELRNIVHKAKKMGEVVKKTGLEIITDGKIHQVSIQAVPFKVETEEYFLVVFEEMNVLKEDADYSSVKDRRVKLLEAELAALREDMRSIVEVQEAANEELQSANEEIVSSNEELQSINEEMETSKEEIESSNEELITINQELQVRNTQLAESQEYSEAVFTTIRESLVILNKELRVKSANEAFYKTFQLVQEDVEGRLFYDVGNRRFNITRLQELIEETISNNVQFFGYEITHDFEEIGEKILLINACKVMQKTEEQHLVLLAIEDITEHRQGQKIIAEREAWFRNMADNAPVMIWVTGTNKLCSFVNKAYLEFCGIPFKKAIDKSWAERVHPDDLEFCLHTYETSFARKKQFELIYRLKYHDGSYRQVLTKAKPNFDHEGQFTGFVGSSVELDKTLMEAVQT